VDTIARELGSLGSVLMEQVSDALDVGFELAGSSRLERQEVTQRETIEEALGAQLELQLTAKDEVDQWRRDRGHLEQRLAALEKELTEQPEALKLTYDVRLSRLTPVGMVYLWPGSR
jgi:ubiquinone biosynthesis protein UbiJ